MALPPVTSGLLFCLQASSYAGLVADGAIVGTWTDQSTAGNNATAAGSPRYYQGLTPAGKPGVDFNNNADFTFANNTMFTGATSGELFIVVKSSSSNTQGPWCFGGNDNAFYPYSDGKQYDGAFTNTRYSWTAPTPTGWHVINISHDGTTRTSRVDNTVVHTATVGFTAPHSSTKSTLRIGHGGTARFTGRIAEVLAYNTSLSSGDRTAVYNHLYTTYVAPGTAVASPVTSGLAFHYQAGALSGPDNDFMREAWLDLSGAANHALPAAALRQRVNRTPLSGRSVQFTGGSGGGYLVFADNAVFNTGSAAEVFAVLKAGATDNPGPWHFGGGGSFYPHPSGVGSNSVYDGSWTLTSDTRSNFANPGVSAWAIYNISHDGTTKTHRFNNTVVNTQTVGYTAPGSSGSATMYLGWYAGATTKFTGEIAEVVAFTRALTTTERDDVYDFLLGRHISAPVVHVSAPTAQFTLTAPVPSTPHIINVPTAQVTVAADAPDVTSAAMLVEVPTAQFGLTAAPPSLPRYIRVPTAEIIAAADPPLLLVGSLTLVSPVGDPLIPSARPVFVVHVVTQDPNVTVVIRYDTDSDWGSPTELSAPAPVGTDPIIVRVRAEADLTDASTYYWQARLVNPFDESPWSSQEAFTTSFADGDALASGTWTVSAATTAAPHLWFARPDRARGGDSATAYGTGFGPTTVTVTLNGVPATVTDWDTVTPDADAYTADRVIDPDTGQVSPGHQVVTFTVPDGAFPGGALYVEGG